MAYTTIDKPTDYFNTKLYTGNGSARTITGVGFQPDWVWVKNRSATSFHHIYDAVRGDNKQIYSNSSSAEETATNTSGGGIGSQASDGFTIVAGTSNTDNVNTNGNLYASWNWLAGGTAPAITYTVKVVSDSGNKYRFDDFGTSAVTLDLQEGGTYTFDQSDSSNSGHPLRFYTASDKSGGEYTTGVTTTGTAGSSGAKTVITVAASAPTLYYQCSNHAGMGGQANTNSTHGSSNFSGSVQTTVSAGSTQGFSIVSYTGTGSVGTFGHGLNSKPNLMIQKKLNGSTAWTVYHDKVASDPATDYLYLSSDAAVADYAGHYNDTEPTSSVFTLGTDTSINGSGTPNITYCFHEVKGYSKFGSYTGTGSTSGNFIYTGFKPSFVMTKRTNGSAAWQIIDTARNPINPTTHALFPNDSTSELGTYTTDYLSNGFNIRVTTASRNGSGDTYIYMAFAESPFVNSNGVPTNAR